VYVGHVGAEEVEAEEPVGGDAVGVAEARAAEPGDAFVPMVLAEEERRGADRERDKD